MEPAGYAPISEGNSSYFGDALRTLAARICGTVTDLARTAEKHNGPRFCDTHEARVYGGFSFGPGAFLRNSLEPELEPP